MDWKPELDAIIGARHGGQVSGVLDRLKALDARFPHVAEIQHQLAWTLEGQGRLEEALPHYEQAVALGLPPNELAGAWVGLGSTLRALGHIDRSVDVLRSASMQFPENREFDAFLALSLHEQGKDAEALRLVIECLCATSEDPGVTTYQRALRHAAGQLTERRQ